MTAPAKPAPPGRSPTGVNGSASAGVGTPLPTRERHYQRSALLVALIVGLAALGGYLYSTAGSKVAVVMVVHAVPAGQVIGRSDLTTVTVSGPVVAFGANRLPGLVGQRAAVPLLPDMFLQRSMVTTGDTLPAGMAQVGVAVRSGQIPADGLAPGDLVQVVKLPSKDGIGAAQVLVARAPVFSSRPDPSTSGGTLVTVIVPTAASMQVAAASSAGQIALIRIAA